MLLQRLLLPGYTIHSLKLWLTTVRPSGGAYVGQETRVFVMYCKLEATMPLSLGDVMQFLSLYMYPLVLL